MRILFVLKDNFPKSGACTSLLNNIFFEGGLIEKTDSIDVLSVKDKYTSLKSELYSGITVHNCVLMSMVSNRQYKQLFLKHPLKVLRGIAEKVLHKLKVDDIDYSNARCIEREMDIIDQKSFDVVVAVMGYLEVAAAALRYKKKNPEVKLVLYQVDPCSSNEAFSQETKEKRIQFEKKLYEISDSIITTPILFEEAKAVYSKDIIDKMLPMEFPNVVPCTEEKKGEKSAIRCLFTGNIYGNFRDPTYTLRLFDKVGSKVHFEMIGSVKPELKTELERHNVIWHGPKSLDETREELNASDILVNIGNEMLNQVPSKVFEYISYGKPIVNVCKNRNCPTLPYLSKYPYALNLFEEEAVLEEQIKMLDEFILENCDKRMSPEEILRTYENCTPQYCAEQMLDAFKK